MRQTIPLPTLAPVKASAKHYAALDGLRGIAILDVMLYHFSGSYKGTNPILRIWGSIADSGWMGVDLFFVLSGFLITGILFDTAFTENKTKNFYARRALRIFPLFYGVLVGLLLLTPVLHLHWRPGHLLFFFYLSNMTDFFAPNLAPVHNWINLGHLWSLAVEEQFYMLWPFVVWWIRDRRKLLWIILGVLIAGPLLRGLLLWEGMNPGTISRLLITRADSLLFGGAVALIVRGPEADRIPVRQILTVSSALFVLLLFLSHGPVADSPWMSSIGYSVIAACSACLVFLAQQGSNWVSRSFEHPFLRFFGRYSYGLYIYHGIYFVYLRHLSGSLQNVVHSETLAQLLDFAFGFGISIGLAMLSYHCFEAPILRLKRKFA
ncbi:MAG TPA: acyltransferase [Granulicella sp.]|jgi:peptidoglycan/LPS O-acetylase OafA/YrhL|nr:acyltransferase [Granulicella sp.]